jgi:hypothetical protein
MIKVTVHNIQEAQNAIKKQIEKMMTDKSVLVGIHEGAGSHGSITNAQLGAVLHFGNDRIPARPWLDIGVQSGNADYMRIIADNPNDLDNALEIVGAVAVGKVQEFMTNLSTPANAPSTIAKKGSSNPLIDTGNLRQSVTYSVTKNKVDEGIA